MVILIGDRELSYLTNTHPLNLGERTDELVEMLYAEKKVTVSNFWDGRERKLIPEIDSLENNGLIHLIIDGYGTAASAQIELTETGRFYAGHLLNDDSVPGVAQIEFYDEEREEMPER